MDRKPKPSVAITGPSRIGICETLAASGQFSSGSGGRPMTYIWTAVNCNTSFSFFTPLLVCLISVIENPVQYCVDNLGWE